MKKKLSSVTFWLFVFFSLIAVQAYSTFAQDVEIRGYWKTGSVGTIQYENRITGALKNGRGSIFTYKFLPNGSYEFVGYMEMNMYNCSNTLFNQITGRYTVDGSTIELNPSRDFWKSTNSCAASGNRQQTKTPTPKSVIFEMRSDDYGGQLLCLTEGGSETCYRKETD